MERTTHQILNEIQTRLKAPKNLYNSFGKYKYRNAEGICEAVKPLLKELNATLTISDSIEQVGDRVYVKATCTFAAVGDLPITATAYAREPLDKKGMDSSQITGATSSYARKYALNGLFLLDDTKDADTDEYHKQTADTDTPPSESNANEKITKTMLDQLVGKCAESGVTPPQVAKVMGAKQLEDLTTTQAYTLAKKWSDVVASIKGGANA